MFPATSGLCGSICAFCKMVLVAGHCKYCSIPPTRKFFAWKNCRKCQHFCGAKIPYGQCGSFPFARGYRRRRKIGILRSKIFGAEMQAHFAALRVFDLKGRRPEQNDAGSCGRKTGATLPSPQSPPQSKPIRRALL